MSMCYVGRKSCGCYVWAAVIGGHISARDMAKEVAQAMRSGLSIEQKPVEWVRENLRSCKCAGVQVEAAL